VKDVRTKPEEDGMNVSAKMLDAVYRRRDTVHDLNATLQTIDRLLAVADVR